MLKTIAVLLLIATALYAYLLGASVVGKAYLGEPAANNTAPSYLIKKLGAKAKSAKSFIARKHFNTSFCFLIDISLPSGKPRFFVYDLQRDSVLESGLVTHGRCNQQWLEGRRYSNTKGSGCTSLGRYKVGASYMGRFGLAYKLYGLDSSNSNAYKRYVVLHAHECVPATETANEICQSDGCPTVSPQFLQQLKNYIGKSAQPVLLWIFE